MTEQEVTKRACKAVEKILREDYECDFVASHFECWLDDMSGRVDGLCAGWNELEDQVYSVAVESKTKGTLRDLFSRIDKGTVAVGALLFGAIGAPMGPVAMIGGALLGSLFHSRKSKATDQVSRYPANLQVIAIPADMVETAYRQEVVLKLEKLCEQEGVGLYYAKPRSGFWAVTPALIDEEEHIGDYARSAGILDSVLPEDYFDEE